MRTVRQLKEDLIPSWVSNFVMVYVYHVPLNSTKRVSVRPCIHRLFPCAVCPCYLVTRHTENEPLFCFIMCGHIHNVVSTKQSKALIIVCVARRKGTRAHATREQPMDTLPLRSLRLKVRSAYWALKFIH